VCITNHANECRQEPTERSRHGIFESEETIKDETDHSGRQHFVLVTARSQRRLLACTFSFTRLLAQFTLPNNTQHSVCHGNSNCACINVHEVARLSDAKRQIMEEQRTFHVHDHALHAPPPRHALLPRRRTGQWMTSLACSPCCQHPYTGQMGTHKLKYATQRKNMKEVSMHPTHVMFRD
jgi:hypothetical protein